jgi:hypothetical protein
VFAIFDGNEKPTDSQRAIWHDKASSQGLVCVICGRPPALERRPAFYDTGLCEACAGELDSEASTDGG